MSTHKHFHDEDIDEALGENFTFFKKVDKYGNETFHEVNNNLVDYIMGLLASVCFYMISIFSILKTGISFNLIVLVFFVNIIYILFI